MSASRDRRYGPSRTSMDDWYLEVCKRNEQKLSVVDIQQPSNGRPQPGSFKYTVKFVGGKCNSLSMA